jgi:hypothetical protein
MLVTKQTNLIQCDEWSDRMFSDCELGRLTKGAIRIFLGIIPAFPSRNLRKTTKKIRISIFEAR